MIEKLTLRCEAVLLAIGTLSMFVMMCLTSADALSRYAFNRPILGAYEITEKFLMVAAIFLGLSYAYRGGVFIRVTFLVDRMAPAAKLLTSYLAHLLSLLFCAFVTYATAQQAIRALADDTTLSALPIPVAPAYCIVPIGFLMLSIVMLTDLSRVRTGQSALLAQESPDA
jgi:TRAP-type C4-dicarboxylate transport system permease small subunit